MVIGGCKSSYPLWRIFSLILSQADQFLPRYQLWDGKECARSEDVDQVKDSCCHHEDVELCGFVCHGEQEEAKTTNETHLLNIPVSNDTLI